MKENVYHKKNLFLNLPTKQRLKGAYWMGSNCEFFFVAPHLVIALPTLR